MLIMLVSRYGKSNWGEIASMVPNRTTRQCRERYLHYLDPSLNNKPWTYQEDKILIEKFHEYGPKWKVLSTFFTNRTDVNIKNHYATILRRWKITQQHMEEERHTKQAENKTKAVFIKEEQQSLKFVEIKFDLNQDDGSEIIDSMNLPLCGNITSEIW